MGWMNQKGEFTNVTFSTATWQLLCSSSMCPRMKGRDRESMADHHTAPLPSMVPLLPAGQGGLRGWKDGRMGGKEGREPVRRRNSCTASFLVFLCWLAITQSKHGMQ